MSSVPDVHHEQAEIRQLQTRNEARRRQVESDSVRKRRSSVWCAPAMASTTASTTTPAIQLPREVTPRFVAEIYPHPSVDVEAYPAIAAGLQAFVDDAVASSSKELPGGYIWQREPLRFGVQGCAPPVALQTAQHEEKRSQHASGSRIAPKIVGSMRHGGSVEDEWLAVHLLMLATQSRAFSAQALAAQGGLRHKLGDQSPGLIVSISDEDGQFVLIEASDCLPSWIQPANAEGRLWLAGGKFHIIDPSTHRGDQDAASADHGDFEEVYPLKVETAAAILWAAPSVCLQASETFHEAIISQRLPSFPTLAWAQDTQHTTLAYLPLTAARLLHRFPQLVADAAEAFEARDGPQDARVLRDMAAFANEEVRNFDPKSSKNVQHPDSSAVLLVQVRLPRRLYATLLAERYFPPKSLGTRWREAVAKYWDILEEESKELAAQHASNGTGVTKSEGRGKRQEERDLGRRLDLGCKIVCGLELAYANAKKRAKNAPRSLFTSGMEPDAFRETDAYKRFISSLSALGYFGTSLPDSKPWKEREAQAIDIWKEMQSRSHNLSRENEASNPSAYLEQRILSLLKAKDDNESGTDIPPHCGASIGPKALALQEDPESFLYDVLTEQRDSSDREIRQEAGDDEDTRAEKAAMEQLNAFSSKLQGFIEGEGDIDGALFDDDAQNDEEGETDIDDEGLAHSARSKLSQMSPEERRKAMDNIVPRLKEEEWGAKAASSRNKADESSIAGTDDDAPQPLHEDGRVQDQGAFIEEVETDAVKQSRLKQAKMSPAHTGRLAGFSRHVRYDGASDSEESIDDEVLRAGDTEEDRRNRARHLGLERELAEENKWRRQAKEDGDLQSEDEDGKDEDAMGKDADVRMSETEMHDFLEFARKELGLSQGQYDALLDDRRRRGAYVPNSEDSRKSTSEKDGARVSDAHGQSSPSAKQVKKVSFQRDIKPLSAASAAADAAAFGSDIMEEDEEGKDESFPGVNEYGAVTAGKTVAEQKSARKQEALKNARTTTQERDRARRRADEYLAQSERDAAKSKKSKWSGARQDDDAFSRLMGAMDAELARLKGGTKISDQTNARQGALGKARQEDSESTAQNHSRFTADPFTTTESATAEEDAEDSDEDMADLSAQDAELLEKMIHSGPPASLQALLEKDDQNGTNTLGLSETERTVMHGMLESYKAQHGGAGPVGSLAGRFGLGRLPEDADPAVSHRL